MKSPNNDFARHLTRFLGQYLPGQRNASTHTIAAYRDTFKLFLQFCATEAHLPPEKIRLATLTQPLVLDFLAWIEQERECSIATRNHRLAALHAFCRYLQLESPEHLEELQRILAIPTKKTPRPVIPHLTVEEMTILLRQPAPGSRDRALLALLYDTGARVQELIDATRRDVRLMAPAVMTLHGKGRKSRQVPLMTNTRALLAAYLQTARRTPGYAPEDVPVFTNQAGAPLTRRGVSYILQKYVDQAQKDSAFQVAARVTPHVFRHSRAVHMLQAGINLVYIRDFLGHATISSTEIYARADTETKRQALQQASLELATSAEVPSWDKDGELMAWLMTLGR